jgi:Phospholipase_D-nuclease N-terminal
MLVVTLVAVITAGFVLPCLIDVARTPRYACGRLSKPAWLVVIGVFWAFGAAAWLLAGRPRRFRSAAWLPSPPTAPGRLSPQQARRRHPAWRPGEAGQGALGLPADVPDQGWYGPLGPDDDPEFLIELERRIRGDREE